MFISKEPSGKELSENNATPDGAEKYQFLVKLALENGAADAKIIPAGKWWLKTAWCLNAK